MKHRIPLSLVLIGAAILTTGIAFKLNHLMGAVLLVKCRICAACCRVDLFDGGAVAQSVIIKSI